MKPEYIIIHHSLTKDGTTVSWGAIRRYHINEMKWTDIGYHWGIEIVDLQYEILLGRLWNIAGAHTVGMNEKSLGICFVGNFDIEAVSIEMANKGLLLVRALQEVFRIPKGNIKGHCEYAPKTCPGKNLMLWVREIRL